MLGEKREAKREQVTMVSIDDLVPKDHILRDIEHAIDFSLIYDLVRPLY